MQLSASYTKGAFRNYNIFINQVISDICYDIRIEHRYSVEICCILIQICLHELKRNKNRFRHHLQGVEAYCGGPTTGHIARLVYTL